MTKVDRWIYNIITIYSEAKSIAIVGPADKKLLYLELKNIGPYNMKKRFNVTMYDYDPQRAAEEITTADVVFDIKLEEDLIINYACEKMWPLGKMYKGKEFILVGDDEHHNGDCNPITSNKQLIKQNGLKDVWEFNELNRWKGKFYMVAGCN
tara:strand:+ start:381 stop:836 length:456 start_codon:yes stop_codon:yes gene_type:complete